MEVKKSEAITELLRTLPKKETVQEICIQSIEIIKNIEIYDASTISIFNQKGILKLKAGFGFDNKVKKPTEGIDYTKLLDSFSKKKLIKIMDWKTKKTLHHYFPELSKLSSVGLFPIINNNRLIGVITIGYNNPTKLTSNQERFLNIIGNIISNYLINNIFLNKLKSQITQLQEVMKATRHNFANDLQSITLGLELISTTNLTEEQQKFIRILNNAKISAVKKIEDLRSMKNDLEREVEIDIGLKLNEKKGRTE
jgi:transcriptional regulator with GAF, ATPase, and Fis domain